MKYDKTIEHKIKNVHKLTKEFLTFIETIGNQCVYTDRIIEAIIDKVSEIKNLHDKQFEK